MIGAVPGARRSGCTLSKLPAGLLSSAWLENWLRDPLKDQRVDALFSAMDRMTSVDEPAAMSPEDVAQEIATMRAERRTKNAS